MSVLTKPTKAHETHVPQAIQRFKVICDYVGYSKRGGNYEIQRDKILKRITT